MKERLVGTISHHADCALSRATSTDVAQASIDIDRFCPATGSEEIADTTEQANQVNVDGSFDNVVPPVPASLLPDLPPVHSVQSLQSPRPAAHQVPPVEAAPVKRVDRWRMGNLSPVDGAYGQCQGGAGSFWSNYLHRRPKQELKALNRAGKHGPTSSVASSSGCDKDRMPQHSVIDRAVIDRAGAGSPVPHILI